MAYVSRDEFIALTERVETTPSYSAKHLRAKIYRCDKPGTASSNNGMRVFLVDEKYRQVIVDAMRAYEAGK